MERLIDGAEVAQHNNKNSSWIVLESKVYDVTSFLPQHPGGAAILLKQAGTDATNEFKKYHPLEYVQDLPPASLLGSIDPNTFAKLLTTKETTSTPGSELSQNDSSKIPHISLCVSTIDFERAAQKVLPHKSFIYASTSANTGLSLQSNLSSWSSVTFRPRILRNVGGPISTTRSILGHPSPHPFYISPMGTMGAIHTGAEPELIRGAVPKGIHIVVSTASTKTTPAIMQSYQDAQASLPSPSPSNLFFQFYMPVNRSKAVELIHLVKRSGYKALWITVDTPVLGKRTTDRYLQAEESLSVGLDSSSTASWEAGSENPTAPAMGGRPVSGQLSPHTTWEDLEWVRREWQGPIVLKGVQCAEDAKMAAEYGVQGVLLSNHGGRQLHSAPSALATLAEMRVFCPEVFRKLEVYVDGGLRDGADVLKAVALGATAVGIGRPFLYALGAYGAGGVGRCVDVLAEELEMAMRLVGVTALEQLRPDMVNAAKLVNEMWRPDAFDVKSRL
ncbi:mitochondrial cytochrome-like protein b2 [Dendryphion nanum]|uniref:Mitochondrial cytochrome-like protein b2 n=1 Tax=Dendryphion nanum TaxID=256645 RepID=A0A9P9DBD7_9PLEO|nr:mitochondrial cytochrome-like protein b2 [Dendryphion nanum]